MSTHGTPAWGAVRRQLVKRATHALAHPAITPYERDMCNLIIRNADAVMARPADLQEVNTRLNEVLERRRA